MARIEALDKHDAQPRSRSLLEGIEKRLGTIPNLSRTVAHSPAVLEGYLSAGRALKKGRLSAREREQIALAVAELNACGYCLAAHTVAGKAVGLGELEVLDARRGTSTVGRECLILRLATEIVETRGAVSDETLRRVRDGGITDEEIVEIVANVTHNIFTNYFSRATRTELDYPRAEALGALTMRGTR